MSDVFAKDLSRRVVTRIAPAELPLFDQTWDALGGRTRPRSHRDPLGFGLPGVDELLVTAIVSGVVTTVLADVGKDVGSWTGRLIGRLRRRPRELPEAQPAGPPPLPPARLTEIRKVAYHKARRMGMSQAQADALADAVVSELARNPS
ncbi:hypothetical protein [Nonomuraea sp. NPDC001023]|uniref:hypothetical protein n=1 Tax=unclassified Nonomuraea TaxID=2593643 RepID=UPI00331B01AE